MRETTKIIGLTDAGEPIISADGLCEHWSPGKSPTILRQECWYCRFADFRKTTEVALTQSVCRCPENGVSVAKNYKNEGKRIRRKVTWMKKKQITTQKNYLGSVRFFKHLILAALALMIAVPSTLTVLLLMQNSGLRAAALALSPESVSLLARRAEPSTLSVEEPEQAKALPTATQPSWQALYPELYAPPAARGTVDEEKTVYLTFDDGPSTQTPKVLEILARYGVKATFFVVGKEDEQSKQWMRDIVAAGHTLGVHSYTHDYKKIYASVEDYLEDFDRIYRLVADTTGVAPTIFRFPGGSINGYNATTYENIISEMVRRGFIYFDWNVATGDAPSNGATVPTQSLVENALKSVSSLRRAVVLMHDSGGRATTVEALPAIIEGYQNGGFQFAPLTAEVLPVAYTYP